MSVSPAHGMESASPTPAGSGTSRYARAMVRRALSAMFSMASCTSASRAPSSGATPASVWAWVQSARTISEAPFQNALPLPEVSWTSAPIFFLAELNGSTLRTSAISRHPL